MSWGGSTAVRRLDTLWTALMPPYGAMPGENQALRADPLSTRPILESVDEILLLHQDLNVVLVAGGEAIMICASDLLASRSAPLPPALNPAPMRMIGTGTRGITSDGFLLDSH